MRALILICLVSLAACERTRVQTDDDLSEDAGLIADMQPIEPPLADAAFDAHLDAQDVDAADHDDATAPPPRDAAIDVGTPPDAMVFPPPIDPTPEIDCDSLDNDGDGIVDEGAANLCGGCGEIPESGCQHWRINLVQDGNGELNPNRVVGLSGGILGAERFDIDNGTCEVIRLVSQQEEGDHLGRVTVDRAPNSWLLSPVLDQRAGIFRYGSDEPIDDRTLFREGDRVSIDTEGGGLIDAFATEVVAPRTITGVDGADFSPFFEALRDGPSARSLRLEWQPVFASEGQMKIYIGGSLVTFRRSNTYQAIEHFVLDGLLADDGELILPGDFFGPGIEGSSVWIYVLREGGHRLVFGPHAVTTPIGRRVEARTSGGIAVTDAPPFSILSPDPEAPEFNPGQDLRVAWSDLPDAEGALDLRFSSRNPETNVQSLVSCQIVNPQLGAAILPATLTETFSNGADAFNQITLRQVIHRRRLPGPDRGSFEHSASVILNLSQ